MMTAELIPMAQVDQAPGLSLVTTPEGVASPLSMSPAEIAEQQANLAEHAAGLYERQAALLAELAEVNRSINKTHEQENALELIRQAQRRHREGFPLPTVGHTAVLAGVKEPGTSPDGPRTHQTIPTLMTSRTAQEMGAHGIAMPQTTHVGEELVTSGQEVSAAIAELLRQAADHRMDAEKAAENGDLERQQMHTEYAEAARRTAAQIRMRRGFIRTKPNQPELEDLLEGTLAGLYRL